MFGLMRKDPDLRAKLVRLLNCHGVYHVTEGDDAAEFETAISSLIEDRFTEGLREGGAILRHPAATPA